MAPTIGLPRTRDAQEAKSPPRYRQPPVRQGDVVLWIPAGERYDDMEGYPAVVVWVGESTLSVAVVSKDSASLNPRDGVMHLDDPRLRTSDARENGAWEYTPQHVENLALKRQVAELAGVVAEMAGRKPV